MKNGRVTELCTALKIQLSNLMEEIVRFIRPTAVDDWWLVADLPKLGLLDVEGFALLEIPVANFQQSDRIQIHHACSTGTKAFRNCCSRND